MELPYLYGKASTWYFAEKGIQFMLNSACVAEDTEFTANVQQETLLNHSMCRKGKSDELLP
jgi:hypothetical protein